MFVCKDESIHIMGRNKIKKGSDNEDEEDEEVELVEPETEEVKSGKLRKVEKPAECVGYKKILH